MTRPEPTGAAVCITRSLDGWSVSKAEEWNATVVMAAQFWNLDGLHHLYSPVGGSGFDQLDAYIYSAPPS